MQAVGYVYSGISSWWSLVEDLQYSDRSSWWSSVVDLEYSGRSSWWSLVVDLEYSGRSSWWSLVVDLEYSGRSSWWSLVVNLEYSGTPSLTKWHSWYDDDKRRYNFKTIHKSSLVIQWALKWLDKTVSEHFNNVLVKS